MKYLIYTYSQDSLNIQHTTKKDICAYLAWGQQSGQWPPHCSKASRGVSEFAECPSMQPKYTVHSRLGGLGETCQHSEGGSVKTCPKAWCPRAKGQVFTDPPKLCWQVDHSCLSNRMLRHLSTLVNLVSGCNSKDTSHTNKCSIRPF